MVGLRDPFEVTHTKPVKGVNLTYVSWSQVADRLDDAAPGWSFTIRQLGEDWCWGQLTIGGQTFENVGYAENAEAAWKKEALKDAVSDALKRCAAMAGVARYLYDKDAPPRPSAPQTARSGSMGMQPPNRPPLVRETHTDGLVGKVATAGTQDFQLRETPTGHALAFRLKDAPNRAGQIVLAHDAIAEALSAIRGTVIGQTVTIWGTYSDEETVKSDGRVIGYKVLHLSRIKTPDVIIPPDSEDDLSDLPDEWKEAVR